MVGGVVVAHENLAKELLNVASTIVGGTQSVAAVAIGWHEDVEEAKQHIRNAIKKVDTGSGVLMMTDMFGGTPSNLCLSFLQDKSVEVVTGVNLPMLIKFLGIRDEDTLADVAQKVKEQGMRSISVAGEVLKGK
ncbi:MAG: PTS sugar transporter subunit IIA [Acidobacteriota bacterium]